MTQTTRSNHSVLRASRSALAGATLLALALGQGCALDPDDPEADGVSPQQLEAGGVGQGILFGGAAGSVDDQRSDLTAAGVPAAVAAHESFAAAPNVKLVGCPTGQLTPTAAIRNPAAANTDELWPGSGKVDVIGPDAYNGKRPDNVTPAGAFGDFDRLAQAAHSSFLISEA